MRCHSTSVTVAMRVDVSQDTMNSGVWSRVEDKVLDTSHAMSCKGEVIKVLG